MNKVLFPNLNWWLLLLVPFTILGFYPSYFSRLFEPIDNIYHVHAFFMSLWVLMAIVQPFLIHYKKISTHKLLGKISYVIMPLVFITGYLVIRHSYHLLISEDTENLAKGISKRTIEEIPAHAASVMMLGSVYYLWLVIFYVLAVINRKKILFHATFMFAATITVLGPTVDRFLYNTFTHFKLDYNFYVENSVFIFIVLLLCGIGLYQWRKKYPITPALVSIAIYVSGIIAFFFLPGTWLWTSFLGLVL
jgi:hypothetical protein